MEYCFDVSAAYYFLVLLSLQNWQASVKSREEEEEEEKKEEKSNIGSQGCAAARGRQPKIENLNSRLLSFQAVKKMVKLIRC